MTSDVEICNRALSKYLGAKRITNLNESSPEAEQCNLHYEPTLRSLLSIDEWYFANARQALAPLAVNDRSSEWRFKYQRPANSLIIRWVNHPTAARNAIKMGETPDTERETTQNVIFSDVEGAVCKFTRSIDDASLFPPYFSDALIAMLAANMALGVTQDLKRMQNAERSAEMMVNHAIALNEANSPPVETRHMPDWMKDRGVTMDNYD